MSIIVAGDHDALFSKEVPVIKAPKGMAKREADRIRRGLAQGELPGLPPATTIAQVKARSHHLFSASKLLTLVPPPERHVPVEGMWSATYSYKDVKERQFGLWLEDLARRTGWVYYHTFQSKQSVPGFPDYTLVKPDRLGPVIRIAAGAPGDRIAAYRWAPDEVLNIDQHPEKIESGYQALQILRETYPPMVVAELKTETGKLTEAQMIWRAIFTLAGIPYKLWRPSMVAEIEEFFGARRD